MFDIIGFNQFHCHFLWGTPDFVNLVWKERNNNVSRQCRKQKLKKNEHKKMEVPFCLLFRFFKTRKENKNWGPTITNRPTNKILSQCLKIPKSVSFSKNWVQDTEFGTFFQKRHLAIFLSIFIKTLDIYLYPKKVYFLHFYF